MGVLFQCRGQLGAGSAGARVSAPLTRPQGGPAGAEVGVRMRVDVGMGVAHETFTAATAHV